MVICFTGATFDVENRISQDIFLLVSVEQILVAGFVGSFMLSQMHVFVC